MNNYGEGTITSNNSLIGTLSTRGNLSGAIVAQDNNMNGTISGASQILNGTLNGNQAIEGDSLVTDNNISGNVTMHNPPLVGHAAISYNPIYALKSESGAEIELYLNTADYTMYAVLKDIDGNTISESSTIELPMGEAVVSGAYDSLEKKIVLTLGNGNTIEFSIAPLISGLQTEINSSNKLPSDLVDDTNQTHKFVTTAEKSVWNGKQDELVSGTNIKTINGNSIVGSGNLDLNLDKNYVFTQSTAAISWVINHNLNKYPAVVITDNSGNEVQGEIVYNTTNQITINFNSSFAGKAILN